MSDAEIAYLEAELHNTYSIIRRTQDVIQNCRAKGADCRRYLDEFAEADHRAQVLLMNLNEAGHINCTIAIDESKSVKELEQEIKKMLTEIDKLELQITYYGSFVSSQHHIRSYEKLVAQRGLQSALCERLIFLQYSKVHEPFLCVAMGFHDRLGAESPLRLLPETVFVNVILVLWQQPEKPEIVTTVKPVKPVVQSPSMFQSQIRDVISSAVDFPFQVMLMVLALLYAAFTFFFGDRQVHMKGGKIRRIERGFYRVGK